MHLLKECMCKTDLQKAWINLHGAISPIQTMKYNFRPENLAYEMIVNPFMVLWYVCANFVFL